MLSNDELLHHYPFRYEDLSQTEQGTVISSKNIYTRSHKTVQKILVKIGTSIKELTYFNQPFLIKTLRPGVNISLAGNEYEVNGPLIHTGRLVPIYPETKGITSKMIRRKIWNLLKKNKIYDDWLPETIIHQYQLISLDTAIRQIHFPDNATQADTAKKRLAFDEMLRFQLQALQQKKRRLKLPSYKFRFDRSRILKIEKSLPFNLTAGQKQALDEIIVDLTSGRAMNRLLTGEVGAGKTVVAAIAMYAACLAGYRAVLMAPTEILVEQHFRTLKQVLKHLKIGRVTKSKKEAGEILVGTQALLNQKLKRLGLVVIDEQHRFGVNQRRQLLQVNPVPHLLTLTATPIPRTLALTEYAHLDLSMIQPHPGRQTVKTWVVPEAKRRAAYDWIKQQIKKENQQAFIVCPLIEPSKKESMADIKAVRAEFNYLKNVFNKLKLGLIHGRMKTTEKNQIIAAFSRRELNILVATPVIEVGIDIPAAGIMVINNAERFGLAQLHQLRGRVGRRGQPAYCLLFANQAGARLKKLETINDGLELAELDLKHRGPGELYGLVQHGRLKFKLADPFDLRLITLTKAAAAAIIDSCHPSQKEKFLTAAPANAARLLN
jgi:ATP-dependent DNA helicase RecG